MISAAFIRALVRRRLTRRLGRRGTVALEFAIIGLMFLTLVLFILELGFYLYVQSALDYATYMAARQMMTGQARNGSTSLTSFQTSTFCPILSQLLSCANVYISLQPVSDFSGASPNNLFANGSITQGSLPFTPGVANSLMLFQAVYLSPSLFLTLVHYSNSLSTEGLPVISTYAYRNES